MSGIRQTVLRSIRVPCQARLIDQFSIRSSEWASLRERTFRVVTFWRAHQVTFSRALKPLGRPRVTAVCALKPRAVRCTKRRRASALPLLEGTSRKRKQNRCSALLMRLGGEFTGWRGGKAPSVHLQRRRHQHLRRRQMLWLVLLRRLLLQQQPWRPLRQWQQRQRRLQGSNWFSSVHQIVLAS